MFVRRAIILNYNIQKQIDKYIPTILGGGWLNVLNIKRVCFPWQHLLPSLPKVGSRGSPRDLRAEDPWSPAVGKNLQETVIVLPMFQGKSKILTIGSPWVSCRIPQIFLDPWSLVQDVKWEVVQQLTGNFGDVIEERMAIMGTNLRENIEAAATNPNWAPKHAEYQTLANHFYYLIFTIAAVMPNSHNYPWKWTACSLHMLGTWSGQNPSGCEGETGIHIANRTCVPLVPWFSVSPVLFEQCPSAIHESRLDFKTLNGQFESQIIIDHHIHIYIYNYYYYNN